MRVQGWSWVGESLREPWSWGGPWGTPPTLWAGWGALSASRLLRQQHRAPDVGEAKCQVSQDKLAFAVKFLGFARIAWKENKTPNFGHVPATSHLKDRLDERRAELPPKDP